MKFFTEMPFIVSALESKMFFFRFELKRGPSIARNIKNARRKYPETYFINFPFR